MREAGPDLVPVLDGLGVSFSSSPRHPRTGPPHLRDLLYVLQPEKRLQPGLAVFKGLSGHLPHSCLGLFQDSPTPTLPCQDPWGLFHPYVHKQLLPPLLTAWVTHWRDMEGGLAGATLCPGLSLPPSILPFCFSWSLAPVPWSSQPLAQREQGAVLGARQHSTCSDVMRCDLL